MERTRGSDDVYDWFNHSVDLKRRRIYMSSVNVEGGEDMGVDTSMAEWLIKGISLLSGTKPIHIIMNNIGGDWFHGMAIYDAIKSHKSRVDIEVYGHAMSMGAVILQAADNRLIHENATVMVHDGYTDIPSIEMSSAHAWADYERRTAKRMYEILAERSNHNHQYWRRKCSKDYIMTAQEALKEGLVDKIV